MTLDAIRNTGESDLQSLLADLDEKHKAILRDAIKGYGRVQDIPDSVWDRIKKDVAEETVLLILLLLIAGDTWTSQSIVDQGVVLRSLPSSDEYKPEAAARAAVIADATIDTVRDRLARKIEDQRLSGPGSVGELTDEGIDKALDETFTKERRETIATDTTTSGLSSGQRAAKERMGGDGASTTAGQNVEIVLYWVTERDDRVCPRCAPLDGTPEEIWSRVFPNGPGPEAHPNCRCELMPRVIVTPKEQAA